MIKEIKWFPDEKNNIIGLVSGLHLFTIYPVNPSEKEYRYVISTETLPDNELKKSKFAELQEAKDHCENILLWLWCKITDNKYIINMVRKVDKK